MVGIYSDCSTREMKRALGENVSGVMVLGRQMFYGSILSSVWSKPEQVVMCYCSLTDCRGSKAQYA